jgi:hypothetical protein
MLPHFLLSSGGCGWDAYGHLICLQIQPIQRSPLHEHNHCRYQGTDRTSQRGSKIKLTLSPWPSDINYMNATYRLAYVLAYSSKQVFERLFGRVEWQIGNWQFGRAKMLTTDRL